MDNATALQAFERSLRRRFPDRSTPIHYVSDVRATVSKRQSCRPSQPM